MIDNIAICLIEVGLLSFSIEGKVSKRSAANSNSGSPLLPYSFFHYSSVQAVREVPTLQARCWFSIELNSGSQS